MCTRYYLDNEDPILKTITEEMEKSPLCGRFLLETGRKFTTSGEVFPTDIVPASWYFEWQHGYKRSPEEEKNAISNSNPILRKDEIRKEAAGKYAIQPAVRGRCQFRSCKIRCFVFRHCELHKSCLL